MKKILLIAALVACGRGESGCGPTAKECSDLCAPHGVLIYNKAGECICQPGPASS